jgi:hypothetical protein
VPCHYKILIACCCEAKQCIAICMDDGNENMYVIERSAWTFSFLNDMCLTLNELICASNNHLKESTKELQNLSVLQYFRTVTLQICMNEYCCGNVSIACKL